MGDEEKEIQFMTEVENVDELNGNDNGEVPRIVDKEKDGGKFDVEAEEEGMREGMDEDEVATLEKVEVEDDKGDAMVEDENEPNEEREYDVEDDLEEEEDSEQESLKKLISKGRTKPVKKDTTTKGEVKGQKDKEPKTPAIERPQRERKSVDRLVSTFEKAKKFEVEKGLGTALKDIPNVQYNLSKKKWDESIKLLHLMLFARRGQAAKYKTNIARFSGVAWNDNEEKQKMKLKERFDKCARGKLLEFCNILDITSVKSTSKKEDIVAKLIEFVKAPHATRDQLIAEIEHGKKRKRVGKKGSSAASKGSSSKNLSKKQKKNEKAFKNGKVKKFSISSEEDESSSSEEEKTHEETDSGIPDISDDVMSNQTESDTGIKVKSSTRKESAGKASKKVVSQKSGQAESEKGVESEDESEEDEQKKKKKKKEPRKSAAKKECSGNAPNKVVLQESGLAESENEECSEDESEEIVKKKESARNDSADNAAKKVVSQKCDKVEREDSGDELEEEKAKERVSKKSFAKKESAGRTAKKVGPQKSDQAESDDSGDESEEEEEAEEEENVLEKEPKESSAKKESAGKAAKEVVPHKSLLPKTAPNRISSSGPKAKEDTNKSAKGSTKRKGETTKKSSTTKKSTAKETSGKMLTKGKENPKEEKLVPGDDELRYAISNILKEVDLHSATFIDIVKQLVKRFEADLMSRKATIKLMIQDELANQTDESEDEDRR